MLSSHITTFLVHVNSFRRDSLALPVRDDYVVPYLWARLDDYYVVTEEGGRSRNRGFHTILSDTLI